MNRSTKIYLIPTTLADHTLYTLPSYVTETISHVRIFLVEEVKYAQQFLKKINMQFPIAECTFHLLNEHTSRQEIEPLFKKILGQDFGIISESGCPCIADPGADIVLLAHQNNIEVIPLVGPSSILLALMASGLNGQNFAFHGYLPKEKEARRKKIKELENRSFHEQQTQIVMEAPYRNQNLFEDILSSCHSGTLLCIACDLTNTGQYIKTYPVKMWRNQNPPINKRPALFLIQKRHF